LYCWLLGWLAYVLLVLVLLLLLQCACRAGGACYWC
jgi:hypothetical protein